MIDPVIADLNAYQHAQERADLRAEAIDELCARQARDILRSAVAIQTHDNDYQLFVAKQAAVCTVLAYLATEKSVIGDFVRAQFGAQIESDIRDDVENEYDLSVERER